MNTTDIAHRETITALVGTYTQATADIITAYAMLDAAKKSLRLAFKTEYIDTIRRNCCGETDPKEVVGVNKEIKRRAWCAIVERMEVKKLMSIKRREELDRQLAGDNSRSEPVAELPDLTEANILAMFQDTMAKAGDYANEAVFEVFDWLRPHAGHTADLKTNEKWRIGKKVIIGYAVEMAYSRGKYSVKHDRAKNLIALDNVFHMLDGKGTLKGYSGPLVNAITESPDGTGETDYFKFKSCKNHNLHIEFKRPDLVSKINRTAGGNRIGGKA
jgi:hypothetical protein